MLTTKQKGGVLPLVVLVLTTILTFTVSSCQKELSDQGRQAEENLLAARNAATATGMQERPFTFGPVAATYNCLGYNVNFLPAQPIILKETVTTDAQGTVHYTRHWSVEGLTARATLPGGAAYLEGGLPVNFVVISGQEMFSIKNPNTTTGLPAVGTSGEVFIHQGTIVLENTRTGERIVIRHVIIKNPGKGILKDGWYVQGQECS